MFVNFIKVWSDGVSSIQTLTTCAFFSLQIMSFLIMTVEMIYFCLNLSRFVLSEDILHRFKFLYGN